MKVTEPLVEVIDVSYTYPGGIKAINGVSVTIGRGEFIALLGHNGSGKTTLAKLMNGLLRPDKGRVLIKGKDIKNLTVSECASTVGYVFQNPEHQIFASTLYDEIAFGPRNLGLSEEEIERRVKEALRIVDLDKPLEAFPHLFSVGEKHRVAIASVIAMEPEFLILDEPTTGIDFGRSLQLMRILLRYRDSGKSVMIITHDLYLTAEFVDRVIILKNGLKIADGPAKELLADEKLLTEAGLSPLQVTMLANRLKDYGFSRNTIRTMEFVEEFIQVLWRKTR